ncbi:hypothetical protein KI387_025590 [Taxus chinensis]|uniref:Glycosyl transferase family 1 domain-containing protein n=1 Tax=Taxus chinensis TaxID=29808 RepID=A0AA38FUY8_TAXCH|nr:hypothetical protein KI387_025590 [Taxus chinensis]
MGESLPFKRLPHNGDSNGLAYCSANSNGTKAQQYALKGRSNSGRAGGSAKFVFESWRRKVIVCIIIVIFAAANFIIQCRLGQNPPLVEQQPNSAEIRLSENPTQIVKFVPNIILQKFRAKNGGINFTEDLEQKRRIPIRPPSLALVCTELYKGSNNLLLLSVANGLQSVGYVLELFSLQDGPVRGVWEKMGVTVNILQSNSPQAFMVDWLNYDGVVVSSVEAKNVISCLMQDPFRMVPVVWIIHENTLGMRLRLYTSKEYKKCISEWKSAFGRANVVVFPDYAMAMMYSILDSGNFFVIPGSPKETWEAEHFMAMHTRHEVQSKLGFTSDNFVIVVVGSPFSYPDIWKEHALVMQAIVPLITKFNTDDAMNSSLKIAVVNNNLNSTYGVALQAIALQLGFPTGLVQYASADDDVNSVISIADMVVYGSFHEEQAFPSILLQAMSFEKPIIAPNLTNFQKYIEDGIHGLLFPLGNVQMMTKALALAISSGKLSLLAQNIALAGRLHARDLMASDAIEGYSAILENVLQFPSEVAVPHPVSKIPEAIKGAWQWQLIEESSESENVYSKHDSKKNTIIFQVEEFWTKSPSAEDFKLNVSSIQEETFSLSDWKEEKEKEMAEDIERREEEELEDRRERIKRTWEDVYRSAKRAERTKSELHERDDGELERTGQLLCIYEPYHGQGAWPFLHHRALYRGIGLSTKGRRPGADDIDAPARLTLLNDAYYRDALCEYGAFFAIANRVDRIHKNSWIGFQSWRAVGRKVSLSVSGEKALTEVIQRGKHGDAVYFWARMDKDTRTGTGGAALQGQEGFWPFCDAINAGNCRAVFSDTLKRMYGVYNTSMAVPPMPSEGGSWSVVHSWAMPTRSFLELVMFARMFVDALDAQHYSEHHDNEKCCLSISKDPHCYCRILELLMNVWAYHSARRMIYVNPETGQMQEQHKLKGRRGQMWVKWFNFSLLKSMDEDLAEDSEHSTHRWLWPLTGEVYWQGIYERERQHRNRLKMEKKKKSKDKLVRMRSRYRQKSLGKYVKPPAEENSNSTERYVKLPPEEFSNSTETYVELPVEEFSNSTETYVNLADEFSNRTETYVNPAEEFLNSTETWDPLLDEDNYVI